MSRRPSPRAGRRRAEGRAVGPNRDGDGDRLSRALTGQVLPIGGVRDKVLDTQRAGLGRVILPRENEFDLDEPPPETRDALRFVPVDSIDEVFDAAFSSDNPAANGRVRTAAAER